MLVTMSVPGRWDSHPHLGVVLLTVPAFGPWDDRAATSRSTAARRQLELRYPAARGDGPYAPMLRHNTKPNAPPAWFRRWGVEKLSDSKERPTVLVSPFAYLRHY